MFNSLHALLHSPKLCSPCLSLTVAPNVMEDIYAVVPACVESVDAVPPRVVEAAGQRIATRPVVFAPSHPTLEEDQHHKAMGYPRPCDAMGNAVYVMGNALAVLPTDWPVARPGLASRDDRIQRVELRRAYAWYIQKQQESDGLPLLPPCTWCGQPTGMWCDLCTVSPARAICSECCNYSKTSLDICRNCSPSAPTGM